MRFFLSGFPSRPIPQNCRHFYLHFVALRCETSMSIFDKFIRISDDNDVSFKEERVLDFIFFIFENEDSHKYVEPNMEYILSPKFRNCGYLALFKILKNSTPVSGRDFKEISFCKSHNSN